MISLKNCEVRFNGSANPRVVAMNILELSLASQLCLAFGMAGLFWPEKLLPVFDVLLFPWAASYRAVRAHSMAAIGLSLLLLARLLVMFA